MGLSGEDAAARWTRARRPRIGPRTLNRHEVLVAQRLERAGWRVLKRGWPDFLAVRGREVRFIEVKDTPGAQLKPAQREVARALAECLGVRVEVARPPDYV